jgi:solute carrier family 25 protein 39/40
MMAVPATVVYFVGYEQIRNGIQRLEPSLPLRTDVVGPLLAGSSARILAATIISPLELIRTNMQHLGRDGTIRTVLGQVASASRREGVSILWRGLVPTLWRDVPFSAIYWSGYEVLRARLRPLIVGPRRRPREEAALSFASGALSGALAAFATTPFDVAKTRRQVGISHGSPAHPGYIPSILQEPAGVFRQLGEIWRSEGPAGLFSGVVPRVFKVAPACAIMIGSYEFGKAFFREAHHP